jgi:hypothetical protein
VCCPGALGGLVVGGEADFPVSIEHPLNTATATSHGRQDMPLYIRLIARRKSRSQNHFRSDRTGCWSHSVVLETLAPTAADRSRAVTTPPRLSGR